MHASSPSQLSPRHQSEAHSSAKFCLLQVEEPNQKICQRLGSYQQIFQRLLNLEHAHWQAFDLRNHTPDLHNYHGCVITGSVCSVNENQPWITRAQNLVQQAVSYQLPLLGVCWGGQLIAKAMGGEVGKNPKGWDLGLRQVYPTWRGRFHRLLRGMPNPLCMLQSHQEIILRLPRKAVRLAFSDTSPIEIFAIGQHTLGVQGHPELDSQAVADIIQVRHSKGLITAQQASLAHTQLMWGSPHSAFMQRWFSVFIQQKLALPKNPLLQTPTNNPPP